MMALVSIFVVIKFVNNSTFPLICNKTRHDNANSAAGVNAICYGTKEGWDARDVIYSSLDVFSYVELAILKNLLLNI